MDGLSLVAGAAGHWLWDRLASPTANEVGEHLSRPVKRFLERRDRMFQKAGETLLAEGVEPRHVPDAVLVPLLQQGVLADSEEMQDRWAALLAAAADPRQNAIPPSFPRILGDMSPADALVLEAVYDTLDKLGPTPVGMASQGALVSHLPRLTGLDGPTVDLAIDGLLRQGLIGLGATQLEFTDKADYRFQLQNRDIVCETITGRAFVKACNTKPPLHGTKAIRELLPVNLAETESSRAR